MLINHTIGKEKKILWNVLLFLVERKNIYFPKTILLYILICIFFFKKSLVLLNFYFVFTIQCRSWYLWSKIIPFTLNSWVCIHNVIYWENRSRKGKRKHKTKKNVSPYNFQSNLKKKDLQSHSCVLNYFNHRTCMENNFLTLRQ